MTIHNGIDLLKKTYNAWDDHHAQRFGASVAFYSLLSFAPLLVVIAAVLALVLSGDQAQHALVAQAKDMMGARGGDTVQGLLQSAQKPASGIVASIIAFITLLFGASGVFTELHDALNAMWDLKAPPSSGVVGLIKDRLISFGMVLAVGFILLVSLALSATLAVIGKFFGGIVPLPPFVLEIFNFIISFAVITGLFALMFRFVPATRIPWRDVLIGSVGTALLFTVGKFALGLYLGKASVGSAYGAAGSLVAVIVWVYYSAQIFFFGAEFTHVYAQEYGTLADEKHKRQKDVPAEAFAVEHAAPQKAKAAAAAVGSPSPQVHPQLPATPVALSQEVSASKPKLLAAASVGFLIGRLLGREKPRRASY